MLRQYLAGVDVDEVKAVRARMPLSVCTLLDSARRLDLDDPSRPLLIDHARQLLVNNRVWKDEHYHPYFRFATRALQCNVALAFAVVAFNLLQRSASK